MKNHPERRKGKPEKMLTKALIKAIVQILIDNKVPAEVVAKIENLLK